MQKTPSFFLAQVPLPQLSTVQFSLFLHLLMENPDATTAELMEAIPGPDFPTGAIVMGKSGIRKAYETGHGTVSLRAKVDIEEQSNGKSRIIVHEIPYMVNKANLITRIADLAREKKIDGITDINDESSVLQSF